MNKEEWKVYLKDQAFEDKEHPTVILNVKYKLALQALEDAGWHEISKIIKEY